MSPRRGARGQAATWPPRAPAGYGPAFPWFAGRPRFGAAPFAYVRFWLAEEVAPGRLIPWLPVAFATGILVYFVAQHEPIVAPASALALALILAAIVARARPIAFPLLVAAAAACAGFATITFKSALIAHPVLHHAAGDVTIAGWVEVREERERSDRIVVKVERLESRRLNDAPERVRVSVRKGQAPPVGAFIEMQTRLDAPRAPLRPGGYDFARDLYFQGIGATGRALGEIKIASPPHRSRRRTTLPRSCGVARKSWNEIMTRVPACRNSFSAAGVTRSADSTSTSHQAHPASAARRNRSICSRRLPKYFPPAARRRSVAMTQNFFLFTWKRRSRA